MSDPNALPVTNTTTPTTGTTAPSVPVTDTLDPTPPEIPNTLPPPSDVEPLDPDAPIQPGIPEPDPKPLGAVDVDVAMLHLGANEERRCMVELYLNAAVRVAENYMQRRVYRDTDALTAAVLDGTAGGDPIVIEPDILAAVLLILGHLNENHEDSVTGTTAVPLPMGARTLLHPHRVKLGV
jgi:hypothetical protein